MAIKQIIAAAPDWFAEQAEGRRPVAAWALLDDDSVVGLLADEGHAALLQAAQGTVTGYGRRSR